jgi:hypothetical protein
MIYASLTKHPNLKYIAQNKRPSGYYGQFFFVIKNDKGEIWTERGFTRVPQFGWQYSNSKVWEDAKTNNGKVFLRTTAGDIEVNEKDFQ